MRTAVIILGHGSRQPGAGAPLAGIAADVRSRGTDLVVEQAFLQYVPPSLEETVSRCVEQGAGRIIIVPFFVQPGAHVTRDIPKAVVGFEQRYPQVRFIVTGHVGGHPMMAQIVEDLVQDASAGSGARSSER